MVYYIRLFFIRLNYLTTTIEWSKDCVQQHRRNTARGKANHGKCKWKNSLERKAA